MLLVNLVDLSADWKPLRVSGQKRRIRLRVAASRPLTDGAPEFPNGMSRFSSHMHRKANHLVFLFEKATELDLPGLLREDLEDLAAGR